MVPISLAAFIVLSLSRVYVAQCLQRAERGDAVGGRSGTSNVPTACSKRKHELGYRMTRFATKFGLVAAAMLLAAPVALAQAVTNAQAAAPEAAPKRGFFVGLQSGLISDSGLAPVVAGYQGQMIEDGRWSVTASGYYMYQTDWSIGTYLGGGIGAFNLPMDPLPGLTPSSLDFGYQGMAGVTYQFSPNLTMGVEYRYLGQVDQWNARTTDTTLKDESQSVSLRFDYSF